MISMPSRFLFRTSRAKYHWWQIDFQNEHHWNFTKIFTIRCDFIDGVSQNGYKCFRNHFLYYLSFIHAILFYFRMFGFSSNNFLTKLKFLTFSSKMPLSIISKIKFCAYCTSKRSQHESIFDKVNIMNESSSIF